MAETIFPRFQAQNPHPKTELVFHTPFQCLVSVVLSAQTTDKMVNKCMVPLYETEFTPQTVLELGIEGFLAKIRTVGLAPTKAKNVVALSHIIRDQYHNRIPDNREELEALPGVGKKTASVVLAEVFHAPTIAVDTHVYRVTQRLGWQNAPTAEKAEQELMKLIDPKYLPAAHHWLILHGRYVCKAINPQCDSCILNDLCPSAGLFQKAKKKSKQ